MMSTRSAKKPAGLPPAAGLALALALVLSHAALAQSGGGLGGMLGGGDPSPGGSSPGGGSGSSGPGGDLDMQSDAYVHRPELNAGLPQTEDPPDLETPQASLANFIDACDEGDYDRASRSLNLNGVAHDRQAGLGPTLARQLRAVLQQKLWIDWTDVPDRPDGRHFGYTLEKAQGNTTEKPRSFYHLGSIPLDHRDVDVYLERVKVPGAMPAWVFSKRTVSYVPDLYSAFGPGPLERRLPSGLTGTKVWGIATWQWIGIALFGLISLGIGWVVQAVVERILKAQSSQRLSDWLRALAWSVHGPIAAVVGLVAFKLLTSSLLRLAGPVLAIVEPAIFVLIVLSLTWLLSRVIDFASGRLTSRYEGEERASNAHEMLTRIKVAKHFFTVIVLLAGLGVALWQFEWFHAIAYGMLASAGIAALILGVAAQRPLSNLFAGVQLAITQPVRVGDAVIFAENWGWIEELAVTYVVIRTWDMRRLVVPTSQLMDNTVENWTKGGENMMKPVYLYADYRVDFAAVRDELGRILKDSEDWDEEVPPILQVTGCKEETIELRALCSARDPSVAWNLHCEVRERLVSFLRDLEGGAYLPRTRVAMVGDGLASPALDGDDRREPAEGGDRRRPGDRRRKGRSPAGSGSKSTRSRSNQQEAARRHRIGGNPRGNSDGDGEGEGDEGT
ncbi:mechanosensitive ion channel family protein [Tautonia plasticadhaerens]|uniref:Mechanosensitive channel MscS n=1 Tax=Tautonia plasticadhaerens TaxID=2527974 RepID=A0A518H3W1_9BACT|nr:mechanosensitive ion channel family protein [Tautonia plasticadhaerens]QDV35497.1 mechanosensitive channel MscS [Tautonia plasticadhaerens]